MVSSYYSNVGDFPETDNNSTHLWMAVMDRAVRDLVALERYLQDPTVMEDPVFRYDYRSLKRWFHCSAMEPGSFQWICSLVNIDPLWALNRLEQRLKICLVPGSHRSRPVEVEPDAHYENSAT